MLRALLLAAAVAAATPAPVPLSPQTQALIAPVHESIVKARADLDALPPPKDDPEKLVRMQKLDQAPRVALGTIDFSKIPTAERQNAMSAIWRQISPIDEANQKALLGMLPPQGWFTISRYGSDAAKAAFLIVQHANLDVQERFLPRLEPLAAKGEVEAGDYALMFDRVAVREGRPQRYGSQYRCEGGKWVLYPLEDLARVDAWRQSVGLSSFAANSARFAAMPPC
jgi:hypothetical protein